MKREIVYEKGMSVLLEKQEAIACKTMLTLNGRESAVYNCGELSGAMLKKISDFLEKPNADGFFSSRKGDESPAIVLACESEKLCAVCIINFANFKLSLSFSPVEFCDRYFSKKTSPLSIGLYYSHDFVRNIKPKDNFSFGAFPANSADILIISDGDIPTVFQSNTPYFAALKAFSKLEVKNMKLAYEAENVYDFEAIYRVSCPCGYTTENEIGGLIEIRVPPHTKKHGEISLDEIPDDKVAKQPQRL